MMRPLHTYRIKDVKYCRMDQVRPIADPGFIDSFLHEVSVRGRENYFCFISSHEKIFSLGGDLKFFSKCINDSDEQGLLRYGYNCIRIMEQIFKKKALTVAYVRGKAFGGGFEVITPFDYVVAEEYATFSLPEIKYNMFPGMGVYTFLSRKIGMQTAHKLITSGKTYSAKEMYELGVVDKVLRQDCDTIFPKGGLYYSLLARKNVVQRDEVWEELREGIHLWVECVMNISDRDLNKLNRVVAIQDKLFGVPHE